MIGSSSQQVYVGGGFWFQDESDKQYIQKHGLPNTNPSTGLNKLMEIPTMMDQTSIKDNRDPCNFLCAGCADGCLGVSLGGHIPERALYFSGFSVVLGVCCVTVSVCFSGIQHHSSQNLPLPGSWLPKYCVFTGWGWTVFQAAVGGLVWAWWPHTSPASSPRLAGPES